MRKWGGSLKRGGKPSDCDTSLTLGEGEGEEDWREMSWAAI